MADLEDTREDRNFHSDVPQTSSLYRLKGSNSLGWGMKSRLARIFGADDHRTVMLAVDHGYFQGPTTGLERIDLAIPPLVPFADALMITRGALRSSIAPEAARPIVLRTSGGPSVLKELSNEQITVDIEDAIRLDAAAMAVQVFIGGEFESQSVHNMTRLVDAGNRYGIPVLGVTAVGRSMVRDARYLRLACRICAELGAHFVKTYYVPEGFETVTASCPVPVIMAGGKKVSEPEALKLAWSAIHEGASGVDMGRNIFQSDQPKAMIQAVRAVVHGNERPEKALDLYHTLQAMDERSEYAG